MRKEGVTAPLARVLLNHIPDMATRGRGMEEEAKGERERGRREQAGAAGRGGQAPITSAPKLYEG